MINISIRYHSSGILDKLLVEGHANTAEYGKDVVCASVSVLVISYLNTLQEVIKIDNKYLDIEISDGRISCNIDIDSISTNSQEKLEQIALISKSTEYNLRLLANQYCSAIQILD